jgi:hypothetical protein
VVSLSLSSGVTGPTCVDATAPPSGASRTAVTRTLSAWLRKPPSCACSSSCTSPASISGAAADRSITCSPVLTCEVPPEKKFVPPPIAALTSVPG